jgi:hypothetical protein
MLINFLQIGYISFLLAFLARFCKFQKLSQKERAKESAKKREPTLTKLFVLNIDFIISLKPDGLWPFGTLRI